MSAPKNQIPWLMLSSPSPFQTQFRYFHSLLPSSDTHEIRLPEIAGLFCIGSSQDFLISPTRTPPTSAPSIPSPGNTSPPSHLHPGYRLPLHPGILVPQGHPLPRPGFGGGPCTVVVTYSCGRLAFARPGDGKWTLLADSPVLCVYDILFHKNRLHAVNWKGALAAFDLWDPSVPHSLLCEGLPGENVEHIKCYLVESPDGQDLYYVTRLIDYYDYDDDADDDVIHMTMSFGVYKLDELERQWIEVNTLGDLALFLGFNHSLSLSATEHPSIKRNSIYFTDDYKEFYFDRPELARDTGVFDVGDGSIQPLRLSDDLLCLNWPPPIWFTPALS